MLSPARTAAYDVLLRVANGRDTLPNGLARIRSTVRDPRDLSLAAEIALGVERHRAALDYVLSKLSDQQLERLDLEVLTILRLSLYQLLHLRRVPASAVVDDAVRMTKRARKTSAARFVNAVLRNASRRRDKLPLPARPTGSSGREAAIDYLSITLSHPRWLAERWLDRFGFDAAEQWMIFNNDRARPSLRVNRVRATPDAVIRHLAEHGVRARPGRFAPDALIVESGDLRNVNDGSFVIQDEASQLVTLLAGRSPGPAVLDTCASPGGKATALAALPGVDLLIACDVRTHRMTLLEHTIKLTGVRNVRLVQATLSMPPPFLKPFNCVIVDAPCSGLGTLRRDPDIRWRRQEHELASLALDELDMLRNAAAAVKAGGRLVYATCSSEPEENEQVAAAFLAGAPDFIAVDARASNPDLPEAVVDERGHLRTRPDRHGLEAFFGAVFERRAAL